MSAYKYCTLDAIVRLFSIATPDTVAVRTITVGNSDYIKTNAQRGGGGSSPRVSAPSSPKRGGFVSRVFSVVSSAAKRVSSSVRNFVSPPSTSAKHYSLRKSNQYSARPGIIKRTTDLVICLTLALASKPTSQPAGWRSWVGRSLFGSKGTNNTGNLLKKMFLLFCCCCFVFVF